MTKEQQHASLYKDMNPSEALKLSTALEAAILQEIPAYDLDSERGWRKFVTRIAERVGWSETILEHQQSRQKFVQLVLCTMDELKSEGVLQLKQ